jgi:hypothetical protein
MIFAGELGQFVGLLVQVIGEPFLFFGVEFARKVFAFLLKLLRSLDHGPVLRHVALLHRVVGGFKIGDISIVALQILVRGAAA